MAREKQYHVKVRQNGEPWRTTWSGPGETVALEAARALFRETRVVAADFVIPIYPYVRVVCAGVNVLDLGPKDRREA